VAAAGGVAGRPSSLAADPAETGNSISTIAPPPGRFAARATPSWARAMVSTIASPRPLPPSLRARAVSARRNRSNACGRKARAVVGHREDDTTLVAGDGQGHHPVLGAVADRVGEQVVEPLAQSGGVDVGLEVGRGLDDDVDVDVAQVAHRGRRAGGRGGHLGQVDRTHPEESVGPVGARM
jgi:hypothetical protein